MLPFCLLKAGLLFKQVLTSLMGRAPNWFLSLFWVSLCNQDLFSGVPGEVSPSVGSIGLLVPGRMLYWHTGDAKSHRQEEENTICESQTNPQKCCGIFKQGNGTPRLFKKQYLLACRQQLSGFTSKVWAPEQRVSPYIPLQAGYRARSKVSPMYGCMHLHWLLHPQSCDLPHIHIL
jgi:hypothetical protein